jgi:GAF domain-containing protein
MVAAAGWRSRPAGHSGGAQVPHVVAAVPGLQAGRVIATLTVGRSDGARPFDPDERAALEAMAPFFTLAMAGSIARREVEEGSPRDATTGLYNRTYLDAALEQDLALRKRTPRPDRPPLAMVMFDIDSFRLLNERHGRHAGDRALRAIATLLRRDVPWSAIASAQTRSSDPSRRRSRRRAWSGPGARRQRSCAARGWPAR